MKPDIRYEDEHLLVLYKPAGVPVQSGRVGEEDLESALKTYLRGKSPEKGVPYLGLIHRLDQPVEGLVVFAVDPKAAAELSRQAAQREMEKRYLAVVRLVDNSSRDAKIDKKCCGKPCENVDSSVENWTKCVDFLWKDGKHNLSEITEAKRSGAKKAVLYFRKLERRGDKELLEIRLETGRHHQIRVQLSGRGMPIVGDRKYGCEANVDNVDNSFPALCAYLLRFRHPATGKTMEFKCAPRNGAFEEFHLESRLL